MSAKGRISVSAEDNDSAGIIDDSVMEDTKSDSETQVYASVEQNTHLNYGDCYVTQLACDIEDLLDTENLIASQDNLSAKRTRLSHNPEQVELVYLRKRQRFTPSLVGMKAKESEYEDGSVIYEYDPDECGSVVSGVSYLGDHQKILMEVLNYCQVMYDAIQKLDKKFDSLHRRVSEIQHTRRKPLLLKQRPVGFTYKSSSSLPVEKIQVQKSTERRLDHISLHGHGNHSQQTKVKLQRANILTSSAAEPVPCILQPEPQHPAERQSPPLPTIVSTRSLCPPFSMTSEMPDFPSQTGLVNENPLAASSLATASPVVSSVMPTPPAASLERNNLTATYNSSPRNINTVIELPSSSSTSDNPSVASSCSLYPQVSTANGMSHLPSQPSPATIAFDSPVHMVSSAFSSPSITHVPAPETSLGRNNMLVTYRTSSESTAVSNEMPSSSINLNFEFVGDPKRNVKVLGNYLMKAKLKTRPKYAARYLVRLLFPKETLLYSVMGARARGRRTLDHNKIAAIREFLTTYFPTYDLSEHGRDWKTCVTNVNAMIRCLRYETKTSPEIIKGKEKPPDTPDTLVYVDLVGSEDESESSIQTSSKSNQIQSSEWDNMPEVLDLPSSSKVSPLEPMAHLGNPSWNVQLPFSIIYVAKGKSRPELSARYLIRHLFTEDVLVKSNVYGNLDRGMYPLDCKKISALRDFLQENYPSFELKETGYDWKACVAAINSTIRSLRYDHKRASAGIRNKVLAATPLLSQSSKSPL